MRQEFRTYDVWAEHGTTDLVMLDNPFFMFLDFAATIGVYALFRWAKGLRE